MAVHTISTRTYVIICTILIALTVLTVAISFAPLEGIGHIILGLTIAVCKATLVVLFFMHVLVSPRLTVVVILVSVFWLSLLFSLTLCDYFSRGVVPNAPGH